MSGVQFGGGEGWEIIQTLPTGGLLKQQIGNRFLGPLALGRIPRLGGNHSRRKGGADGNDRP